MEFVVFTLVLLLLLGAYWSLVIFPRQRDFSKRQRFVSTLGEGDEVITAGGVIGRVIEVRADEGIAFVEIADGLIVRMVAASLLGEFDAEELARNAQRGLEADSEQQENPATS